MDTHLPSGLRLGEASNRLRLAPREMLGCKGQRPLLMGSRGARRLSLVVVQGAKALTVSNRRTVGRGVSKGARMPPGHGGVGGA